MIEYKDILSFNYYTYNQPFTGSYKGMRYRLVHQQAQTDEEGVEIAAECLLAEIWPEPFAYEETDRDLMTGKQFPFNEEGRIAAVDWLNERYENGQWTQGFTASMLRRYAAERR
jgi:hypothetical protein